MPRSSCATTSIPKRPLPPPCSASRATPARCASRRPAGSWRSASTPAFAKAFAEKAAALRIGNGLDAANQMGPLANSRRIEAMTELVADAKAKGAKVLSGGARLANRGYYFPLTVLSDLPDNARAMREEPFGPLAAGQPGEDIWTRPSPRPTRCPTALPPTPSPTRPATSTGCRRRSRSATCRSTTTSPRSPRRRSAASRTAATAAKAASRDCRATRW